MLMLIAITIRLVYFVVVTIRQLSFYKIHTTELLYYENTKNTGTPRTEHLE